jgi:uncharacterized protein YqjF (DUF2071 family)
MHDVRIGLVPFADFLETNLRTYVHAEGVPGVWFFSLDAASRLAVWGGRTLYGLPYFRAKMSCAKRGGIWDYQLRRAGSGPGAGLDVQWTLAEAEPREAAPGTLEHFLTERYALYGRARGTGLYRVRVHHRPWPLHRARLDRLSTTLPKASELDVKEPVEVVLASVRGVSVQTFAKEPVRA